MVEVNPENQQVQTVKLIDFGLGKLAVPNELMYECCGTPAYVAPEVLIKCGYNHSVDVWSTGIIMYTLIARNLPFHARERK